MRLIRFPVILGVLALVMPLQPNLAHADSLASSWSKGMHSSVRLTAATLLGDGNTTSLYAGVDIRLDKNWKTYWKFPGDGGGVPPEFNWSQSQNVRDIRVMYPAPKVLKDAYGLSIGYKDGVLFPVSVTPVNPLQPVRLRLKVYFGVCEEICIPAEASLKLDIAPGARAAIPVQRDLMTAMARVPGPVSDAVELVNPKAILSGKKPHLIATVQARDSHSKSALFVSSKKGDYFPIAKPVGRDANGATVFRIDLSHLDNPQTLVGQTLDLIGTAGDRAVQMSWTIKTAN